MTRRPRGRSGTTTGPDGVQWDKEREEPLLASADADDDRPFNPLDTSNLAKAVAKAVLEKDARPLGTLPVFRGAGIYVIYYSGGFPTYQPMALENQDVRQPRWPIYIGKAQPPGGRKGGFNLAATDTTALHGRLREHAESIRLAGNLDLADFQCRYLVVQDLWIPLAESLLITHFSPVWNQTVDGFGNHDPGAGRYNGFCPRWDVLHPGRAWAIKCKQRPETASDIQREIQQRLAASPSPSLALLAGDLADS